MGILKKIQEMKQEMTRWRQKMHAEPELAFEERWTARFLTRQLQDFGVDVHPLAKTGVVGTLKGKQPAVHFQYVVGSINDNGIPQAEYEH